MNTKPFTPDSDFRQLLAMDVFFAYVIDTKANVHCVTSNCDTPEEFMQDIEKSASLRGYDIAHVAIFNPADYN